MHVSFYCIYTYSVLQGVLALRESPQIFDFYLDPDWPKGCSVVFHKTHFCSHKFFASSVWICANPLHKGTHEARIGVRQCGWTVPAHDHLLQKRKIHSFINSFRSFILSASQSVSFLNISPLFNFVASGGLYNTIPIW